ncbi:MAG: class I tRNA ligase family protein, partial [Treponema sp.]|nr:class I tRNA ligase family protein [Treponema sp.]
HFPASFISEGLDQTRGWFYSLTVLAALIFDRPAFLNCIVNGIVLAEDGRKMSKSLRNYTDPVEAIDKFGADSIRLFLMHSAVVRADEIRYSDDGVRDTIKSIILPLWNSYSFFVQYANIDGITCTGHEFDGKLPDNPLDRWLLSVSQKMVREVTAALDDYDLSAAIDPWLSFIEQINNWYIRRNRRRFWRSGNDSDKLEAYGALYIALRTFTQVAAPFIPFLTEIMWRNLRTAEDKESVHLTDYPVCDERLRDERLEFQMATVQKAVVLGRSLRNQFSIKNRQPLSSVALVTRNAEERKVLAAMEDTIAEELNVKQVIFHEREDELVEYRAKANFKALGKTLGGRMKAAAAVIAGLSNEQIAAILDGQALSITVDGVSVDLTEENVLVERLEKESLKVANDGTLTVGLDTAITESLRREGYARDLVRGIQNLRKESGLSVTDRIQLAVSGNDELLASFEQFKSFIMEETLATRTEWGGGAVQGEAGWNTSTVEAEEMLWTAAIKKVSED